MKSSYKLLGAFWDGLPVSNGKIDICIMPTSEKINIVALSEVFETENLKSIQRKEESTLALLVDYFPHTKAVAVIDFYIKRVLQIAEYYQASMICCKKYDELYNIVGTLYDWQKRRTPNKLLAQSHGVLQMIC